MERVMKLPLAIELVARLNVLIQIILISIKYIPELSFINLTLCSSDTSTYCELVSCSSPSVHDRKWPNH